MRLFQVFFIHPRPVLKSLILTTMPTRKFKWLFNYEAKIFFTLHHQSKWTLTQFRDMTALNSFKILLNFRHHSRNCIHTNTYQCFIMSLIIILSFVKSNSWSRSHISYTPCSFVKYKLIHFHHHHSRFIDLTKWHSTQHHLVIIYTVVFVLATTIVGNGYQVSLLRLKKSGVLVEPQYPYIHDMLTSQS